MSKGKRGFAVWVAWSEQALYKIRIEDYRTEKLLDMWGIDTTGSWERNWAVVDPHGNPLILRAITLSEIYALDVDLPRGYPSPVPQMR